MPLAALELGWTLTESNVWSNLPDPSLPPSQFVKHWDAHTVVRLGNTIINPVSSSEGACTVLVYIEARASQLACV